jgi:hypothetical protein
MLVLISVFLLAGTGLSRAEWIQVGGPEPPVVGDLGTDGTFLFMGTNDADAGDVYRSADGILWSNARLPNGGVNMIETHGGRVFVGTYLSGLWFSTDSGASWTQVEDGIMNGASIGDMASLGGVLFAGLDFFNQSVQRSFDGGVTWSSVPGSPSVVCNVMDAIGPNLFIGTNGTGIYRSTDGGVTWNPSNAGLPGESRVTALTEGGGAIFAGVYVIGDAGAFGVYRSTTAGASWTKVSTDLPANNLVQIRDLLAVGGVHYAALSGSAPLSGVYKSTNGGVNWIPVNAGLPAGGWVESLLFDGSALFAGTAVGAFRSTDGGASWARSDAGTAAIRGVSSFLVDGAALLCGLTTNGGMGRGIWRTADHGTSWLGDPNVPAQASAAVGIVRLGPDLFSALDGGTRGIVRSSDGGGSWVPSSNGLPANPSLRALDVHQGILLAGAWDGLYRSTDAGASWSPVAGMTNVSAFASLGGEVFAGHYGTGVSRSTDGGATWTSINAGLTNDNMRTVNHLAVHEGSVHLASNGAGVLRFNGASWVPVGLAGEFIDALLSSGSTLIAAVALGVNLRCTTDGGATWAPFDTGYTGGEVYELAADEEYLFAGARGRGVWIRPLTELPQAAGVAGGTSPASVLEVFPNPSESFAGIRFVLPRAQNARLTVHDVLGREVAVLVEGALPAGVHEARFDPLGFASGQYFVNLRASGRAVALRRLTLVR